MKEHCNFFLSQNIKLQQSKRIETYRYMKMNSNSTSTDTSILAATRPTMSPQLTPHSSFQTKTNNRAVVKKSVNWNVFANVIIFERATAIESKNIWFSASDFAKSKANGIKMASSYRKMAANIKQIQHQQPSASSLLSSSSSPVIDHRGFESCTDARRRYRLLSNRCAIHAHKHGMKNVAAIYQKRNKWARKVALVQAIHDYIEIYDVLPSDDEDDEKRASLISAALRSLPPVASMIPPTEFSTMTLKRKMIRPSWTEQDAETIPRRRVKQRVTDE